MLSKKPEMFAMRSLHVFFLTLFSVLATDFSELRAFETGDDFVPHNFASVSGDPMPLNVQLGVWWVMGYANNWLGITDDWALNPELKNSG